MKRAGKRKHSSVGALAGASSPVVTEAQKKRRKITPGTGSTKNAKKSSSVRGPTTSGESRPPSVDTSTGYACPICLESTRKDEMTSLQCFHAYHRACINEWLTENRRCPVCRQEADPPQNASPPEAPRNASPPDEPPQNARSAAPPQNARSAAPPQNARSVAPPRNARSAAAPRNARPPVNTQSRMISRELQALPGVRIGRNMRLNNGGIDMMFNDGNFMTINNNGLDMRLNIGGFEVRLNNGGFTIQNNR